MPDLEPLERREVPDLADDARVGIAPRVGRVETVGIGQQDQFLGAHQHRHLRRQEVVVPERDLVGRGRVVLVDDRQHAPLQQLGERLARVQVVGAGAHVKEREQHLGAGQALRAQQLVIDPVQLALPHRARGLQLADRGRPLPQLHDAHAARDRAARNENHLARAQRTRARAPACAARRRHRRPRSSRASPPHVACK